MTDTINYVYNKNNVIKIELKRGYPCIAATSFDVG